MYMSKIENIVFQFIIWFLFVCCSENDNREIDYKFNSIIYNLPIVSFPISGRAADFLVDSGAEKNILDIEYYNTHEDMFIVKCKQTITVATANGIENMEVIVADAIIDGLSIEFCVGDISSSTDEMTWYNKYKFVGVLGYNFIRNNGILIDFNNNHIYYGQKHID